MDFIEQWFGVSPDNGDGSLELLWIVIIVFSLVAITCQRGFQLAIISEGTPSLKQL